MAVFYLQYNINIYSKHNYYTYCYLKMCKKGFMYITYIVLFTLSIWAFTIVYIIIIININLSIIVAHVYIWDNFVSLPATDNNIHEYFNQTFSHHCYFFHFIIEEAFWSDEWWSMIICCKWTNICDSLWCLVKWWRTNYIDCWLYISQN